MTAILYSLCGATGVHYSPHVWKCIMALEHKGLSYTLQPVSFGEIKHIEDGSFSSVPVLNDGGTILGDSFSIAEHLEKHYPSLPSLFQGQGGCAVSRFVESYCKTTLHPPLSVAAALDMHNLMGPADQDYFRTAREKRFGKSLEEVAEGGMKALQSLPEKLAPIRDIVTERDWIGGDKPLFADYILFGTLQWVQVCGCPVVLEETDPVHQWFQRCLGLYNATG